MPRNSNSSIKGATIIICTHTGNMSAPYNTSATESYDVTILFICVSITSVFKSIHELTPAIITHTSDFLFILSSSRNSFSISFFLTGR